MTKRNPQQEMYELSTAMPIIRSQLATWCGDMDALEQEIKDQGTVIVTQVEQLNQADAEIERLTDINNALRKEIQRLNAVIAEHEEG